MLPVARAIWELRERAVLTNPLMFPPQLRQLIIVQWIDRKDHFDALNSLELEADVLL